MDFDTPHNKLTQTNGAVLLEVSSCRKGCSAFSLITNEKTVWVSEEGLPQSFVIDISNMKQRPEFNYFGWYCWHSYTSNPAAVELDVTADYTIYKRWCNFQAPLSSRPQIFSIDAIGKNWKAIRVTIRETFGAANTYMNKVFLLDKYPREKKFRVVDESFTNISDISSTSVEVMKSNQDLYKNPKSKLRFQLEELRDTVENMKNRTEPCDDLAEIKNEVSDWQSRMGEINSNLKILIEKVSQVENNARRLSENQKITQFKQEIINEITKKKKQKKRSLDLSRKFNQVTDKFDTTEERKAGELLSMIHTKTEEKLRKIMQLQLDKLKIDNY